MSFSNEDALPHVLCKKVLLLFEMCIVNFATYGDLTTYFGSYNNKLATWLIFDSVQRHVSKRETEGGWAASYIRGGRPSLSRHAWNTWHRRQEPMCPHQVCPTPSSFPCRMLATPTGDFSASFLPSHSCPFGSIIPSHGCPTIYLFWISLLSI